MARNSDFRSSDARAVAVSRLESEDTTDLTRSGAVDSDDMGMAEVVREVAMGVKVDWKDATSDGGIFRVGRRMVLVEGVTGRDAMVDGGDALVPVSSIIISPSPSPGRTHSSSSSISPSSPL